MSAIPTISKQSALEVFNGDVSALASALQITPSAVYLWPDGPIPEKRALQLCYQLRPDAFDASGRLRKKIRGDGSEHGAVGCRSRSARKTPCIKGNGGRRDG